MEYPSNSHKAKTADSEKEIKAKPKVEKVVDGSVIQKKKPLSKRIAETFVGDDLDSVGHYILFEVFIPAAKSMLSDAASQGVERLLFGESSRRGRSSAGSRHTSYNKMFSGGGQGEPRPGNRAISNRARAGHNFDEVVLEDRGEAEEVLDRLNDLINQYDVATVSDFYDLVGITGSFVDDKWGWTNLRDAHIRRVRDGYLISLPKTSPID